MRWNEIQVIKNKGRIQYSQLSSFKVSFILASQFFEDFLRKFLFFRSLSEDDVLFSCIFRPRCIVRISGASAGDVWRRRRVCVSRSRCRLCKYKVLVVRRLFLFTVPRDPSWSILISSMRERANLRQMTLSFLLFDGRRVFFIAQGPLRSDVQSWAMRHQASFQPFLQNKLQQFLHEVGYT